MVKAKAGAPAKVPEIVDKDPLGVGTVEGEKTTEATPPAGEKAKAEEPVPPAPGEDAETVFDRRLARLTTLVEQTEFESGTAFGDLRDCMLDLFKSREPKAFNQYTSDQQRAVIRAIEAATTEALRKVVFVVAQEDDISIEATFVGEFKVKGEGLEGKIKLDHVDGESLLDVYRMAGHRVVIISADSKRFMSARRTVEAAPDQLGMTFADDKTPKAPTEIVTKPPGDDSDLAGGPVEESVADKATRLAEAEGAQQNETDGAEAAAADGERTHGGDSAVDDTEVAFAVRDETNGVWLIDEKGGDEGWTDNRPDAGVWPKAKAEELRAGFDNDPAAPLTLDPVAA